MQTSYAAFLYNLSKAYEQFCMTEDAKNGNAYMCFAIEGDGNPRKEESALNQFFFNATGADIVDIPEDMREELYDTIRNLERKHGDISWAAAYRTELFGDKDSHFGPGFFSFIYSNNLRAQWLMSLYEKEVQK